MIQNKYLTKFSLLITSLIGLFAFFWPFLMQKNSFLSSNSNNAGFLLLILVPLVIFVALADVLQGGIDSRSLAILGVLTAVVAAIRPIGGQVAGLEPVWAIIIIGGRALVQVLVLF